MRISIPSIYIEEYKTNQTVLIKARVKLLCALSIFIYFLAALISYFLYPRQFKTEEIPLWIFLIVAGVLIFISVGKTKTEKAAKTTAFLFIALMLIFLTAVCLVYSSYINVSGPLYLFVLFLAAFTIPWAPIETIFISTMHIMSYSLLFWYGDKYILQNKGIPLNLEQYYDGIIFLLMGFVLCFVVRAKEIAREIENFILLKDIENKNEQIQKELELATRVHKTLIPKSISTDIVDIEVMYLPMYYIGGDYAKFHFLDNKKLIFIICDVTGHGVPAALLVNRLHTEVERYIREGKEPGTLLHELDNFILHDFAGINMYLTAFCGLLDFNNNKLIYSNHGHPPQYLYRISDSSIKGLYSQGTLLGLPFDEKNIYQQEIKFEKGDKIFLFTDGLIETKNKFNQRYGKENLEKFIELNRTLPVNIFNQKLFDELNGFKDINFEDDIFVLNIQIK